MKVVISVHGRFHAFELAAGLHDRGILDALLTTYPRFSVRHTIGVDLPTKSAWWIEARRRLVRASFDQGSLSSAFGKFAAKNLPDNADILVGWSSATLEAIKPARENGMKIIIERGSTHIAHQTEILSKAYADHGQTFSETSSYIIEREEAEYREADAIAVPSSYAKDTFTSRHIAEQKLIVNPYGVDLMKFSPTKKIRNKRTPRILFVGQVSIRKGVPDLIMAFSKIYNKAELLLVGPIEPIMQKLLAKMPMERVQVKGAVPSSYLPNIYREADIFCLPSLEEGLPLVLLQAMASGLPIVATTETGAQDVIIDGKHGRIVSANNHEALCEALETMISDAEKRHHMGKAARARIKNSWSWNDYIDRSITAYQNLIN